MSTTYAEEMFEDLWRTEKARAEKAEARVAELESQLRGAHEANLIVVEKLKSAEGHARVIAGAADHHREHERRLDKRVAELEAASSELLSALGFLPYVTRADDFPGIPASLVERTYVAEQALRALLAPEPMASVSMPKEETNARVQPMRTVVRDVGDVASTPGVQPVLAPEEVSPECPVCDGKGAVHCGDANTGTTYPCTEFYKACPVVKAREERRTESRVNNHDFNRCMNCGDIGGRHQDFCKGQRPSEALPCSICGAPVAMGRPQTVVETVCMSCHNHEQRPNEASPSLREAAQHVVSEGAYSDIGPYHVSIRKALVENLSKALHPCTDKPLPADPLSPLTRAVVTFWQELRDHPDDGVAHAARMSKVIEAAKTEARSETAVVPEREALQHLVEFVRADQCDAKDECLCCDAYLQVANVDASKVGLPDGFTCWRCDGDGVIGRDLKRCKTCNGSGRLGMPTGGEGEP